MSEHAITPATPTIRTITLTDLCDALRAGFADCIATARFSLPFGLLYAAGGWLILFVANVLGYAFLAFPLVAGFTLIGPFAAIGLYEISRLRERGAPISWPAIFTAIRSTSSREVGYLGLILFFIMAIWLKSGAVIYAMFFGLRMMSLGLLIDAMTSTAAGLGFIITGHLVGAGFALAVFSISVVSFPLIVDRGSDFITALTTSIHTVRQNARILIPWGIMIGLLLALGSVPAFLGLILVLPVLGHASWHLYRRVIA